MLKQKSTKRAAKTPQNQITDAGITPVPSRSTSFGLAGRSDVIPSLQIRDVLREFPAPALGQNQQEENSKETACADDHAWRPHRIVHLYHTTGWEWGGGRGLSQFTENRPCLRCDHVINAPSLQATDRCAHRLVIFRDGQG